MICFKCDALIKNVHIYDAISIGFDYFSSLEMYFDYYEMIYTIETLVFMAFCARMRHDTASNEEYEAIKAI